MTLRFTAAISQLENDLYTEEDGADSIDRAFRRGHNVSILFALAWMREGFDPALQTVDESDGTDENRAYCRGRNAGVRHARSVLRVHAGLHELAYAPLIRTVAEPLFELGADFGGEA